MNANMGMFWSGETLTERLAHLIEPFDPGRVDCAAYTLAIGPEIYVSPSAQTVDPATVTVRKLAWGDAFVIPPGQFAFLLTEESVGVPCDAIYPDSAGTRKNPLRISSAAILLRP